MKVLFLDIDGVLNNEDVFHDKRFGFFPIDCLCVKELHRVSKETGCYIVLSSSWRGMEDLERKLEAEDVFIRYDDLSNNDLFKGFDRVNIRHPDGSTKRLSASDVKDVEWSGSYCPRGYEIKEWLDRHPEVENYAIVDDETDMLGSQMNNFVKTDFLYGLRDIEADKLIKILEG